MKNKGLKIVLFIFFAILILLIVLSVNDYKSNKNINNINIDEKDNSIKKDNDESNNISSNDNNKEEKVESGPAETEEEENINEKVENVTINIELIGEEEVYIKKGEKFIDPGVKATDENGNDVSDKITVENTVNENKKGSYMVIYSYGKSIVIRKVIVE